MGSCCSGGSKTKEENAFEKLVTKIERGLATAGAVSDLIFEPKQFGVGPVDGKAFVEHVEFDSEKFGDTNHPKNPFALKICIDKDEKPYAIGNIVKRKVCPEYKDWIFKVVATCGDTKTTTFGDPCSIWYNVFLGYYEIEVKKSDGWDRPFGYYKDGSIHKYDFAMLFNADWNYISNWMYGVPTDVVDQYLPGAMGLKEKADTYIKYHGRKKVFEGNDKFFDYIELMDIPCASSYESRLPNARKLNWEQNEFTPFWQMSFGLPEKVPDRSQQFPTSFPEAKMRGREWVYHYEKKDTFHTIIFGAFANNANPPSKQSDTEEFLDVQQKACGKVVNKQYGNLGWEEGRDGDKAEEETAQQDE